MFRKGINSALMLLISQRHLLRTVGGSWGLAFFITSKLPLPRA